VLLPTLYWCREDERGEGQHSVWHLPCFLMMVATKQKDLTVREALKHHVGMFMEFLIYTGLYIYASQPGNTLPFTLFSSWPQWSSLGTSDSGGRLGVISEIVSGLVAGKGRWY
jgi:hypothetical protein